jgi:DNA polymerase
MKEILTCSSCNLCNNQKPLLDNCSSADVMWVGLSAKKVESLFDEIPLANNTNTGKIVADIENDLKDISFYKTNIVKCLPLNEKNKLRYPNLDEMKACLDNFNLELEIVKPSIVFLLGKKVSDFVFKQHREQDKTIKKADDSWFYNNTTFISIYHPSYIYVYKRKFIADYVDSVQSIIEKHFSYLLREAS